MQCEDMLTLASVLGSMGPDEVEQLGNQALRLNNLREEVRISMRLTRVPTGAEVDQWLAFRKTGARPTLLVNRGIGGCFPVPLPISDRTRSILKGHFPDGTVPSWGEIEKAAVSAVDRPPAAQDAGPARRRPALAGGGTGRLRR